MQKGLILNSNQHLTLFLLFSSIILPQSAHLRVVDNFAVETERSACECIRFFIFIQLHATRMDCGSFWFHINTTPFPSPASGPPQATRCPTVMLGLHLRGERLVCTLQVHNGNSNGHSQSRTRQPRERLVSTGIQRE